MKRTLTINISGVVFHIDEDAYEKLKSYLLNISRHFGGDPEGQEIIMDIEARISELFSEKLKGGNEVITIWYVDEIIEVMGRPEDFIDVEEDTAESSKKTTTKEKKLYRDPDNRVLGGVCAGLGAYLNIDPIIIRLAFFILFWFSGGTLLLVYFLFWIVVPRAKNSAQRLEMRGEDVNIENIKKTIKDEFQDVKESYKRFRSSDSYDKGRKKLDEIWVVLAAILRIALKVLIVIIGLGFIVAGAMAIISLIGSLFISHELWDFWPMWGHGRGSLPMVINLFSDSGNLLWLWISVGFVAGIPLLALIYFGSKLVFRYKSNNALIGLTALVVWIISIIVLFSSSVGQINNFKRSATNTNRQVIESVSDTLYLKLNEDDFGYRLSRSTRFDDMYIVSQNGKDVLLGKPEFDIEKSSSNEFEFVVRAFSKGKTSERAFQNAKKVQYNFIPKESSLVLDQWFQVSQSSKWRDQEVDLILKVPKGKTVYIEEGMEKIIHDIENTSNIWDGDMPGNFWKMKSEGLTLSE
jgi:phage shock protein PspC (stress-responsive transcriptional regulator)